MEVKVGSKLRNNDPRNAGQVVVVTELRVNEAGSYAIYQSKSRRAKIRLDRIVTDPKGNLPKAMSSWKQGWTLIDPNAVDVT